jgi:hypothetical protein
MGLLVGERQGGGGQGREGAFGGPLRDSLISLRLGEREERHSTTDFTHKAKSSVEKRREEDRKVAGRSREWTGNLTRLNLWSVFPATTVEEAGQEDDQEGSTSNSHPDDDWSHVVPIPSTA